VKIVTDQPQQSQSLQKTEPQDNMSAKSSFVDGTKNASLKGRKRFNADLKDVQDEVKGQAKCLVNGIVVKST
jgi:hypothetical protein